MMREESSAGNPAWKLEEEREEDERDDDEDDEEDDDDDDDEEEEFPPLRSPGSPVTSAWLPYHHHHHHHHHHHVPFLHHHPVTGGASDEALHRRRYDYWRHIHSEPTVEPLPASHMKIPSSSGTQRGNSADAFKIETGAEVEGEVSGQLQGFYQLCGFKAIYGPWLS